jgi:hypothetical protein
LQCGIYCEILAEFFRGRLIFNREGHMYCIYTHFISVAPYGRIYRSVYVDVSGYTIKKYIDTGIADISMCLYISSAD